MLGLGLLIPMREQAGGNPYNPLAVLGTDLIAWWDADSSYWGANGNMTLEVDRVTSWKDIVAGYDATQSSGSSARPTFSATGFNGGPGVSFDGSDDVLTSTTAGLLAVLPVAANASELWVLIQQDALPADATARYAVTYGNTALNNSRAIGRFVSAGVNRGRGNVGDNTSALSRIGTIVDLSTRHVERWQIQAPAGTSVLTIDGIAEGSVAADPTLAATVSRLRLGASANTSANAFWQGQAVAVLVTKPLSSGNAAALQSWLLGRRRL